jgi:hypothetical protein
MLAVTAHEFEHMIHWNHDSDEASWVDEGMAELAMWFYGAPDNISSFNSNPDNSLIVWNGDWADYIKTYLWSLYFYEQYGGQPSVYAVVQEPANSIQGYENVLDNLGYSQNFEDVFADWTVANYLDDTPRRSTTGRRITTASRGSARTGTSCSRSTVTTPTTSRCGDLRSTRTERRRCTTCPSTTRRKPELSG